MTQNQSNLTAHTAHALAISTFALAALLTGCSGTGAGTLTQTAPGAFTIHATGTVHGGQNPVTGSTIQLYTVGTSTGATSTALLTATVTSSDGSSTTNGNANAGNGNNTMPAGSFTISGDYSCTSATQVYLVASGGNPGSGNNSALTEVAALGSCASLLANAATTTINMSEVTTVAAAYALAPFATNLTHIGSASTIGITNAFANAQSLANTGTGLAGGASLPTGAVAPVAELNTLANILAACVNTTGPSSTACTTLFTATGASDTFGAALAIAHNPGAPAITALYTLPIGTGAPFQPTLSTQPNDFSVAVTLAGTGVLSTPYAIAIDASGNAWVTNESGHNVTAFSPSGAQLSDNSFSAAFFGAQGIAIARDGTIWVAATASNVVHHCTVNGGNFLGCGGSNAGVSAPSAIAVDSAGNAWIANFNGNSVTEEGTAGAVLGTYTGSSNNITSPTGIAVGPTGAVYVTSGQGYVVKLNNAGAYQNNVSDNALQGPASVALNASGQIAVTGFTTGSSIAGALGEFTDSGSVLTVSAASPVSSGLTTPAGVATDGVHFWVANSTTSGSLAEYTYGSATPVSPTAGFGSLNTPVGVAVDLSGCVWTANSGNNTISQFIGLASSYNTPIAANVGP
jgi:hypothetical protein